MLTIGTGIGGGLILGGEIYRGSTGPGPSWATRSIEIDGPPCQGNCPARLRRDASPRDGAGREGRRRRKATRLGLGTMLAEGQEIDGKAVTEAALGGDATAIGVFDLVGGRLGVALAGFANIFEPK
jgi:glucokinase